MKTLPPAFGFHPQVSTTTFNGTIANTSLYVELTADRTLSVSSTIITAAGSKEVTWSQSLSFQNIQNMTDSALNQSLSQISQGSYSDSFSGIETEYSYPINLYSSYIIAPSLATLSSVFALIDRSLITKGIDILSFLSGTSSGS